MKKKIEIIFANIFGGNYEKQILILGTSDAWLRSSFSHQPSDPVFYIEDCRISTLTHTMYFGMYVVGASWWVNIGF